ncbi:MAG TPA: hypothetical protein VFW53_07315, partial [Gallionella sp.]|nr:hypothetical protein [Gallionella sp.]
SLSLRRRVDLTVLLLANGILLVPVIGLALIAPTKLVQTADKGFLLAAACVLVALLHLVQLAALERKRAAFIMLALADLLLGWSLSRPVDFASRAALCAALACAAAILLPYRSGAKPFGSRFPKVRSRESQAIASALLARLSPAWRIQVKALWLHRPASSAIRMGIALMLAIAADGLMNIFMFDQRTLPTAILCMGALALVVSGIYRVLEAVHLPMRHYLASLPLHRHFWIWRDTAGVCLFGSVPLAILLVPMLNHAAIASVLALATAYFGLLALLRLPLAYGGRQALLLSVLMVGAWAGVAMAAIR